MAPDIRQYAEMRQTIAATPAAPLIVVRTSSAMRSQRHKIQNFYIPKQPLTFRMKLNAIATTDDMTLLARMHIHAHQPPHLNGPTKEIW